MPGGICQVQAYQLKKWNLYQYDKEFSLKMTETTYKMGDKMLTNYLSGMLQILNNMQAKDNGTLG